MKCVDPASRAARTRHADALWAAVSRRDEDAALQVVVAALQEGHTHEQVLLDVVAPVQNRVGREWAAARLSVPQEHAATAINERVVAAVSLRRPARTGPARGKITVACVDGEWHGMPARLLSEVLRLRGWDVDHLGAQVPTEHLVGHLHLTGASAVALSASLPPRLPTAHAAVTACQAVSVPVLVGGAAFGPEGRYARLLGADAWAPDAVAAADILDEGLPPVRPRSTYQALDDLPHLADQEYTLVTRTRPQLVRRALDALTEGLPAARAYSAVQRERTAEDLAHIVEFLGAALYVDDVGLFTGFLHWTAEVLQSRGVPPDALRAGLGSLAGVLTDFPRASRLLSTAANDLPPAKAPDSSRPGKTA